MANGSFADLGYVSMDSRRTARLPLVIPVEISYADQNGRPCLERTQTKDVDRHGARLTSRSYHPEGRKINLGITHLGRSAHTRVVWCSAPINGFYEVGVELESPENVWGVQFETPTWTSDLDPVATLWTLVQILEEKGIITREELRARGAGGPRPSAPASAVPWMNHRI
jgi:hypothetical protein